MNVRVLSCAEAEFAEAVDFYNAQRPGLGFEFAAEVRRTFDRIAGHPGAWSACSGTARRCRLDRFPYAILYREDGNGVLVGAIMHLERDPLRWQDRAAGSFGQDIEKA